MEGGVVDNGSISEHFSTFSFQKKKHDKKREMTKLQNVWFREEWQGESSSSGGSSNGGAAKLIFPSFREIRHTRSR